MPRPIHACLAVLSLLLAACEGAPGDQRAGNQASPVALTQESHPLAGTIWDVDAGAPISADALTARLAEADIVILGEVHDNPQHHARQADLVAELSPNGLAFEMVPEGSEEGIAAYLDAGGTPGGIGPAIGWDRLGWPDWSLYRPIFEAAPAAYIAGGAVASRDLSRALRAGAAAGFGRGAGRYDLDIAPDPATMTELEDEMIAAHCNKLPRVAARSMAEAQRLRDARFARAAERAWGLGGGLAVLITGNGHARSDRGVPAYLAVGAPNLSVLSLGQVEVVNGADQVADYENWGLPYDYVWFSARADRPDPCDSFQ
ncbi:MAG: ChaN family lipoprotein [Pseudomonadota bacterium]